MYLNLIKLFTAFSLLVILCSCSNNPKNKSFKEIDGDSLCMKKIVGFADTLKINPDNSKPLNKYFDGDINLDSCSLKKFRSDFKVKQAIILLICKINDFQIKRHYYDFQIYYLSGTNYTCAKVLNEYYYLLYKTENNFPEFLKSSDVFKLIDRDKRLFENPQIKDFYLKFSSWSKQRKISPH
jgi:hypothetical protein